MPNENKDDEILNEKDVSEDDLDNISWDEVSENLEKENTKSKSKDEHVSEATANEFKKTAEFSELKKSGTVSSQSNIDFILDIPLQITVELGRTNLPIYDLLQLGQGSIIELNKLAGEPLEILVNQKLIAKGEVVVVNEKFGIRLTDIISPAERVEKLG